MLEMVDLQWLFLCCLSLCWLCSSASDSSCLSFLLSILSLERFRDFLLVFLWELASFDCLLTFLLLEWYSAFAHSHELFFTDSSSSLIAEFLLSLAIVLIDALCELFELIMKMIKHCRSSVFECKNKCTKHESFSSDHESFSKWESWNLVDVHVCYEIHNQESDQSSETVSDKSGKKSVAFHMWKNEEIEFLSMREHEKHVNACHALLMRDWLHSKINESFCTTLLLVFVHIEYVSLVVVKKPNIWEALRNKIILLSCHIESTSWSTSTWKTIVAVNSWSSCSRCSRHSSKKHDECDDIFHSVKY